MAVEVRDYLRRVSADARVHLLPAACPVHRRQPGASAEQRLAMLELAVADEPGLVVDDREIRRGGPSYMVDTLLDLRRELGGQVPLILVVGADAFNGLPSWHRWLEIPRLAHIMIMNRPGWSICDHVELQELLTKRQAVSAEELSRYPAGKILRVEFSRLDISSSQIRACIAQRRSPRFLLPDPVWRYIQAQGLYVQSSGEPLSNSEPRGT